MKTIYLIAAMLLLPLVETFGQNTIGYFYDNNGNRTTRKVIAMLKRKKIIDTTQVIDHTATADSANNNRYNDIYTDEIDEQALTIYPNPTKGILRVQLNGAGQHENTFYIEMYSLSGTRLLQRRVNGPAGELDISNFKPGMYLMNIKLNGKVSQWNIIKE